MKLGIVICKSFHIFLCISIYLYKTLYSQRLSDFEVAYVST